MGAAPDREPAIRPLEAGDAIVVERLWQLYSHDMSQLRGTLPNGDGLFKPGRLERYLAEPADYPGFLLTYADAPAGFAFVMYARAETRHMGDFFVARAVRRQGAGALLARHVIELDPGNWEIAFQDENTGAPDFWKRVVSGLVGDAWREEWRPVPDKPHIPPDHWLIFATNERDGRGDR